MICWRVPSPHEKKVVRFNTKFDILRIVNLKWAYGVKEIHISQTIIVIIAASRSML